MKEWKRKVILHQQELKIISMVGAKLLHILLQSDRSQENMKQTEFKRSYRELNKLKNQLNSTEAVIQSRFEFLTSGNSFWENGKMGSRPEYLKKGSYRTILKITEYL